MNDVAFLVPDNMVAPTTPVVITPSPAVQQRPYDSIQSLTPQTLVNPVPDVTQAFMDAQEEEVQAMVEGGIVCRVNQMVSDNPIVAALVLVGVWLVFKPRRGR